MNHEFVFVDYHDNLNLTEIGQKQKTCIQPKTYLYSKQCNTKYWYKGR